MAVLYNIAGMSFFLFSASFLSVYPKYVLRMRLLELDLR